MTHVHCYSVLLLTVEFLIACHYIVGRGQGILDYFLKLGNFPYLKKNLYKYTTVCVGCHTVLQKVFQIRGSSTVVQMFKTPGAGCIKK